MNELGSKVLFIYPDFKINIDPETHSLKSVENGGWYMEGIASISAVLKESGHHPEILHMTVPMEDEGFIKEISARSPDIIGFVTMTREYPQVKRYAEICKNALPDVPVISGSYHPTALPRETINTEGIDIICVGEGEYPMLELANRLAGGNRFDDIKSLWVKDGKEVIMNPVRPLIEDIDTLPLPDFELFDFKNFQASKIKTAIVILSRGCPYSCTYCSNKKFRDVYPNKNRYSRFHSPEYSIEYLKKLRTVYPEVEYLNFRDDILPWKENWLEKFVKMYKKDINLPFMCNYRANYVSDEIIRMLKSAGCYQIFFGVESGNDYIRNEILKRHMKRGEIINAFEACRKEGIRTVAYNMVGIPFEDKKKVLDTIKLNVEIKADISLSPIYYPYPDTKLYEIARDQGFVPENYDYREDRYVDQPTLPRDELYFVRHYFKLFVKTYQSIEKLPHRFGKKAEIAIDRLFMSNMMPHRFLVRVAATYENGRDALKRWLSSRFPGLYIRLRDRIRGIKGR